MRYIYNINKKPSLDISEDKIGNSNNVYWLLDGATSSINDANKYYKQTIVYLDMLDKALSKYSEMYNTPEDILYNALCDIAYNGDIESNQEDTFKPSATVVMVKIEPRINRIDYLVLGYSHLFIEADKEVYSVTDDRLNKVAVVERNRLHELVKRGVSEDSKEYKLARASLIQQERKYRNEFGGYWIAELNPEAAMNAITGIITYNKEIKIIAASDGLERITSLFGLYNDLGRLEDVILKNGDRQAIDKLRALESKHTRIALSKHDDASYFILEENKEIDGYLAEIERQKAEIERLNNENEELWNNYITLKTDNHSLTDNVDILNKRVEHRDLHMNLERGGGSIK